MAEHVYDEGLKNAAIIYANSDYNLGLKNVFEKVFTNLGGKIVATETYEQSARDFKSQLTKIKAKNPDALYIVSYSEGGLIAKQARELGMEMPFFAPEVFESKDILDAGGDAVEGVVFTKPKFDAEAPQSAAVIAKYKEAYAEDPEFAAYMTNAYDATMLIAQALEEGKDIKRFLYDLKEYDGAGGKLTIDQNGDAVKDFQLMIIEAGKFVPYEA